MSEDQTLETALEEDATLEDNEASQAFDDERPTSRSDAKDPWHGLNDFDEE